MPKKAHCRACSDFDTIQMVSCCHCKSLWHYDCVDVNDSIAADDRTFTCPECQKPSTLVPTEINDNPLESIGRRARSVADSRARKSSCSSNTKRAQLALERLEAMKELALKQLDLERRAQEQQNERRRLQVEIELLDATFRLREEIELADDEEEGNSVITEQSSPSKVEGWKKRQQPFDVHPTSTPKTSDAARLTVKERPVVVSAQPGLGGEHQPLRYDGILEKALVGISLDDSAIGPTLGGILDRTSSTIMPPGNAEQLGVLSNFPYRFVLPQTLLTISEEQPNEKQNSIGVAANGTSNAGNRNPSLTPFIDSLVRGENKVHRICQEEAPQVLVSTKPQPMTALRPNPWPTAQDRMPPEPRPPPAVPQVPEPQPMLPPLLTLPTVPELQPVEPPQPSVPRALEPGQIQPWLGPTPRQIATRQVMPKELPTFTGKAEEWPMFISSYVNSTQACGYSNVENLCRLQKCLKGEALDYVQSLLLLPEGVPHVIAQLEQLYGRPELLIHTLLQKIREAPTPKEGDPNSLVTYGLMVQNLCNHVISSRQEAHLNNPELLLTLVAKLPTNWMMDWSLYKERCATVNLQTFAHYMQVLVRAGLNASLYCQQQSQYRGKQNCRQKNYSGVHSSEESSGKEELVGGSSCSTSLSCLLCKNDMHRVKDCPEFIEENVDERWRVVQRFRLCRLCLGGHGRRPCQIRKQCDIAGCQQRHHPLLHDQ